MTQPPINVSLTMEDVTLLIQQNPLFAAQLQNIAMLRMLREKEQELANTQGNGKAKKAKKLVEETAEHAAGRG